MLDSEAENKIFNNSSALAIDDESCVLDRRNNWGYFCSRNPLKARSKIFRVSQGEAHVQIFKRRLPTSVRLNMMLWCRVITGGSTGIGFSLAKKFAALGANVTIMARTEAKLKSAVGEIKKSAKDGVRVEYKSVDVTDEKKVFSAMEYCEKVAPEGGRRLRI
eukprot:1395353-Amorphochlora_amoeboformis.AAC.5